MGKKRKEQVLSVVTNVFIWVCAVICAYPIYWLVTTAFKTRVDAFAVPPKWIFTPTLENIKLILGAESFMRSYLNSALISFSTVFLALFLGIPMAYALARFPIPKKRES